LLTPGTFAASRALLTLSLTSGVVYPRHFRRLALRQLLATLA
jgi:hypothetical protein